MSSVEVQGLRKTYGGGERPVHALNGIDLKVDQGEFVVLLGPSGCGKSTLLRSVAGLEHPTAGSIRIAGRTVFDAAVGVDVKPNHRPIGMVFQNYALWPHMTVLENVRYPLRAQKRKDALKAGRAERALGTVQCAPYASRYPSQLSGGQQQRIALARALSPEPAVMLLDEPLSNLDAQLRVDLRAELRALHQRVGFTGLYVTHDQSEALHLGSRVVVMRAGTIEQQGTPSDIYERPATRYVAEFLGIRNRLHYVVEPSGLAAGNPHMSLSPDALPGVTGPGAWDLFIRSEDLRFLGPDDAPLTEREGRLTGAVVTDSAYLGSHILVTVALGGTALEVVVPPHRPRPDPGSLSDLACDLTRIHAYPSTPEALDSTHSERVSAT